MSKDLEGAEEGSQVDIYGKRFVDNIKLKYVSYFTSVNLGENMVPAQGK